MEEPENPPTAAEALGSLIGLVIVIAGAVFLMAQCGGCMNAGSRLFLK
jgi:hypothetical protein